MNLNVRFSADNSNMNVKLNEGAETFKTDFGEVTLVHVNVDGDPYTGDYTVIPKVSPQVLHTRNKVMSSDVTVCEIPYAEVSNVTGGVTATIG